MPQSPNSPHTELLAQHQDTVLFRIHIVGRQLWRGRNQNKSGASPFSEFISITLHHLNSLLVHVSYVDRFPQSAEQIHALNLLLGLWSNRFSPALPMSLPVAWSPVDTHSSTGHYSHEPRAEVWAYDTLIHYRPLTLWFHNISFVCSAERKSPHTV